MEFFILMLSHCEENMFNNFGSSFLMNFNGISPGSAALHFPLLLICVRSI
jgi:hypothetical protein